MKNVGAQTEEKIIETAVSLFVRYGYHATPISEITGQVGLTKGAFYTHFKSKAELVLKILEIFQRDFIDKMKEVGEGVNGSALDKLHKIVSFNSKFAIEYQDLCVFHTFLTIELKNDNEFEAPLKSIYRNYQDYISSIIIQGQEEGLLKKEIDPDMAALTFMGLHDGILHQWVLNRERIDGKMYVRTFRKIFFQGISAYTEEKGKV